MVVNVRCPLHNRGCSYQKSVVLETRRPPLLRDTSGSNPRSWRIVSSGLYIAMAAVDVGVRDVPPINDDLDELFNYDVDNDLLRETDTNMDVAPKQSTTSREKDGILDGLGLDEEIKVTKKRAPIAKLDENRYGFEDLINVV